MVLKRVLCPHRLRRVPSQFSWIDHRLVKDRHICGCSHAALALYLFLITVADLKGLSYYSDGSIARMLSMDSLTLARARRNLQRVGLIAYEKPVYQVLALDTDQEPPFSRRSSSTGEAVPIGEVLRETLGLARKEERE